MGSRGRPARTNEAERERVRELARAGVSIRKIATLIFGDARYRGRVERILDRPEVPRGTQGDVSPAAAEAELEAALASLAAQEDEVEAALAAFFADAGEADAALDALAAAADEGPSLEELVALARKRLEGRTDPTSIRELETLLKLERELEVRRTLERLNDLTRETD